MAREQELKAAYYGALSRFNTCNENLATFRNDLKDLTGKYLQCSPDQVVLLDKDGNPGNASFADGCWQFGLGMRIANIEFQVPIVALPGNDIETVFIARLRDDLSGFQIPLRQHRFVEHIFQTVKRYLDNAVIDQQPDKPIRIGF